MRVVGIDVGAERKGFHLVCLEPFSFINLHDPHEAASWCKGADLVAIDCPSEWAAPGERSRPFEREMIRQGYPCFCTPSEERARGNPFYDWVRNGLRLWQALESHPRVVEVFPRAISDATTTAGRRAFLRSRGVDEMRLSNRDLVDAAVCCLADIR